MKKKEIPLVIFLVILLSLLILFTFSVVEGTIQNGSPRVQYANVTNTNDSTISASKTATGNLIACAAIDVGGLPFGVAVNPVRNTVYAANAGNSNISVIDAVNNSITATVKVGNSPIEIAVSPDGSKVYAANQRSNNVSVIDSATNTITNTVSVGRYPTGIAVSPDGSKVYVANQRSNNISVIDTAKNMITATVNVGAYPTGVAVSPDGKRVFVTNARTNSVSVIDIATNTVTGTVPVGINPCGIETTKTKVYVANYGSSNISVIDIATNTVTSSVSVGVSPWGVAVNQAETKVYVTNDASNTVSVINTANNTVTSTVNVGNNPLGVAVSPDGSKVYVANHGGNYISVIDTTINPAAIEDTFSGGNLKNVYVAFGQFTVNLSWYNLILDFVFYFISFIFFIIRLLITYILFFIFFFVVMFFLDKLVRKKSFEQIHRELHFKKTLKGEISVINDIHSYLHKYTFAEILFYNLKCNGIRYYPYCHYFFPILLIVTLYNILYISFAFFNELLSFLFIISTILLPLFIFIVINIKAGVGKPSWKKSGVRLFTNAVKTTFIIIFTMLISNIFLILQFPLSSLNDFDQKSIFSFPVLYDHLIHSITLFLTYLYEFNINDVESNQLSLSGYYFSLAVGGTVILSIIDRYFEEEDSLKDKLIEQVSIFNEAYSELLSLNLSDIISFNFKSLNLRKFNIKKVINYNDVYIKDFANILFQIQTKLECEEIADRRKTTDIYELFIYLVVSTYILGILIIFLPQQFATFFLWIFIIDSIFFGILIYIIYTDYRK